MSLNGSLGLGVMLEAKDLASGVINKFGMNLTHAASKVKDAQRGISDGLQVFGAGMGLVGIGAAAMGGLTAAANVSGEFNEAIAATGAVANATKGEILQLKDAALEAGIATQFSPKQAAVGLGDLAQAGYNAKESIELLNPVLNLAAGSLGKLTPSQAAGLAAQTLKAFSLEVGDASGVVDKLLQSVNAFALSGEELPLALGTASRGAQVMKQSLDETLISLGLVKNIIPSVERASTAVAVAMERMVNPKTAGQLAAIGVKVADAKGKFRPFLDVLQDMAPALAKMTDQKAAGFLEHAFGAEALGGIQAIMTQITKGIRTSTGETVKGAAAIKNLREQFANSTGTARNFADALLDTYAGQKKLVKGSLETLSIVVGEPLEKAFRPFVEGFLGGVNKVIATVKAMPEGFKVAVAKIAIALAIITPVIGVLLAAKGAAMALSAGMAFMGVTFGGAVAAMLPVLGVVLALGAAFATLRVAYERDLGGFATFVDGTVRKSQLAFDALVQVFTQGGFSGAVLKDLNKAENEGVKAFAISVYVWVNRIRNFFRGLADGFSESLKEAEPVFDRFTQALGRLSAAFGITTVNTAKNAEAFDAYGASGKSAGQKLAEMAVIAVDLATHVLDIVVAAKPLIDAFADIVKWSMDSNMAILLVRDAVLALAAVKIAEGMLAVTTAIKAIGAAAAAANIPILPFTAAIAGLTLALDQFLKLWNELGDSGLGDMWKKFKLDVGIDPLERYEREIGIKTGEDYDAYQRERARDRGVGLSTPAAQPKPPSPGPMASVVQVEQQKASFESFASMAAMQQPQKVEVMSTVPVTVMMPDGEVLASVVAQAQSSNALRNGTPGSME